MKYIECPVCHKNGYYLPTAKNDSLIGIDVQYAPRCKMCNSFVPFIRYGSLVWAVALKDVPIPWKNWQDAKEDSFILGGQDVDSPEVNAWIQKRMRK